MAEENIQPRVMLVWEPDVIKDLGWWVTRQGTSLQTRDVSLDIKSTDIDNKL